MMKFLLVLLSLVFIIFLLNRLFLKFTNFVINHWLQRRQEKVGTDVMRYEVEIDLKGTQKTFAELMQHLTDEVEQLKGDMTNFMVVGGQENGRRIARRCLDTILTCMLIINYLDNQKIDLSNLTEGEIKNVN